MTNIRGDTRHGSIFDQVFAQLQVSFFGRQMKRTDASLWKNKHRKNYKGVSF